MNFDQEQAVTYVTYNNMYKSSDEYETLLISWQMTWLYHLLFQHTREWIPSVYPSALGIPILYKREDHCKTTYNHNCDLCHYYKNLIVKLWDWRLQTWLTKIFDYFRKANTAIVYLRWTAFLVFLILTWFK